jgi:CTP:phosphocholine cytidylyltransferase-like protein
MNAVILAAGMGTRLRPLTETIPKTLVPIKGKPMIERQIENLSSAGIRDITIVGGYLCEKLSYLKTAYPRSSIEIIDNTDYAAYNNIYSLYLARHLLAETFIVEGDVFHTRNLFLEPPAKSSYFIGPRSDAKNEWAVSCDASGRIRSIDVASGDLRILTGVSLWKERESAQIRGFLEEYIAQRDFKDLFWDHIMMEHIAEIEAYAHPIGKDDWREIDSIADVESAERLNQIHLE